jgi:glycosyltransferase involved in cell wall biosynthesis
MNVLHLISSTMGYYGAERVAVTLSAAIEDAGSTSIVGVFHNTVRNSHLEALDQARLYGLKAERIPCQGRIDKSTIQVIRGIVERYHIDVIHCHGIKPNLYAYLAARDDIALVSTCHLWVFDSTKDWVISALERCMLHGVDRVVAVSDHIIPQLRRFGVRAEIIYNGIDLEPFRNPPSDLRQGMGWYGRPVIGAIGRLAPQKGLKYLLQAAPRVLQDNPDALFVFVGDGPERQSLEADARTLGIQDAVSFLGVREDIPAILASIDVLAMPSLSEGLPMALLEAMASSRAVVASGVGAIPHVIEDKVNGIILAPGDVRGLETALLNLLKSRELRVTFGNNARETVESRFSAASMAKQYLDVYREAIDSKAPAALVV